MTECNELYHHGVLGMKWGVRRSSVTEGGLRSAKSVTDASAEFTRNAGGLHKTVSGIRSQKRAGSMDLNSMSDAELRNRVARLNLEQQYQNLSANNVSKGERFASNALSVAGSVLATTGSALAIAVAIKQLRKG